jgi:hypothetical protein
VTHVLRVVSVVSFVGDMRLRVTACVEFRKKFFGKSIIFHNVLNHVPFFCVYSVLTYVYNFITVL